MVGGVLRVTMEHGAVLRVRRFWKFNIMFPSFFNPIHMLN